MCQRRYDFSIKRAWKWSKERWRRWRRSTKCVYLDGDEKNCRISAAGHKHSKWNVNDKSMDFFFCVRARMLIRCSYFRAFFDATLACTAQDTHFYKHFSPYFFFSFLFECSIRLHRHHFWFGMRHTAWWRDDGWMAGWLTLTGNEEKRKKCGKIKKEEERRKTKERTR